jgi:hypothetical protein
MNAKFMRFIVLFFSFVLAGCFSDEISIREFNTEVSGKSNSSQYNATDQATHPPTPTQKIAATFVTPEEQENETGGSLMPNIMNNLQTTLIGPLILLDEFPGMSGFYLWDLGNNQIRELRDGDTFTYLHGWEKSGCELIVNGVGGEIVVIDLVGNRLHTVFDASLYPTYENEKTIRFGYLSPENHRWVYYFTGSGEYIDTYTSGSFEFVNLEVIPTDGSSGPHLLVDNGRAKIASWSTDGRQVAYSHTKDDGSIFVYIAYPDKSEVRALWELPRNSFINSIDWSPDSKYILTQYGQIGGEKETLSVISNEGIPILHLDGASPPRWWYDNQSVVVSLIPTNERGAGLTFIDIITGETKNFISFETPYGYMLGLKPFPDNPRKIGYFIAVDYRDFFIYDIETGQYEAYSIGEKAYELDNWYPGPLSFPGEAECSK